MFKSLRIFVAPLMLATPLLSTGCGDSSIPPPVVETQTVKIFPPAGLMADLPPPALPDRLGSRDDLDQVTLDLAGWGAQLRARLAGLRAWAAESGQ